jgi:hypothetical protein
MAGHGWMNGASPEITAAPVLGFSNPQTSLGKCFRILQNHEPMVRISFRISKILKLAHLHNLTPKWLNLPITKFCFLNSSTFSDCGIPKLFRGPNLKYLKNQYFLACLKDLTTKCELSPLVLGSGKTRCILFGP